jgi:nucleoside phosphorylase
MSGSSVQAAVEHASENRVTAIVAALPEELAPFLGRASVTWTRRIGRMRVYRGSLAGAEVVLAATGDGGENAEEGLVALLAELPIERLLVVGISGGLSPRLRPGAVLLAAAVLEGGAPAPGPDPAWLDRARAATGLETATLVTAPRIVSTPEDKSGLWATSTGEKSPAMVDLETARFAKVAARSGVPYLAVRSVCDPAEEGLPFDLNLCTNERGGVSRARVLRYAVLHPGVIGSLWQLRRRVERCSRDLATTVEQLLRMDTDNGAAARPESPE